MKSFFAAILFFTLYGIASAQTQTVTVTGTWTDNSTNEQGFEVERKIGLGVYARIATTAVNVTSFKDSVAGDAGGSSYCYRVRAFNGSAFSTYSNEACVKSPVVVPGSPSNLTLTITVGP